jgi:transcriptional regulator with XRE-family HTH domain
VDDRRVGLVLRQLRRRRRWRQVDLSGRAGVSQSAVSRAELGHLDTLSVRRLRSMFAALDARVVVEIRWRGGEVDRLADEGHAQLVATVADELQGCGWQVMPEVTFMRQGERGSIDLLAYHPASGCGALFEMTTEITSAEETLRRFDGRVRVAQSVTEERFGQRPHQMGAFLVMTDTSRNRTRLGRLAVLVRSKWPSGTRAVRQWVRQPAGSCAGVWFVRSTHPWGGKRGLGGSHRVRRPYT